MTTPEENIKTVQRAMAALASLLSPDVSIYNIKELSDDIEWIFCGSPDSPFVGKCVGKSALEKTFQLVLKTTNTWKYEGTYLAQDNKVVMTAWETFQLLKEETGFNRQMSYNLIAIYTLTEQGIISKCEQMSNIAIEGMFGYPADNP